jgi:hypothetical protein
MIGKRLDFKYVQEFFLNQGCELLEKEYKNARTKMEYKCQCGNLSKIVFDSFQRGNRCKLCGNKKCSESNKTVDQEIAVEYFKSQGCELLDVYRDSSTSMNYRCSCGTLWKSNWNNFKKGKRCKECARIKRSGPNNYQWIPDREAKREYDLFKQRCYKLLKMALASTGQKKNSRTEQMLGYSTKEFQKHITNHPNWQKLKNKRWHVDHIYPIKAFADHGITDIQTINCLENLQPLWYKDNLKKSDSYDSLMFEEWLKNKGIKL